MWQKFSLPAIAALVSLALPSPGASAADDVGADFPYTWRIQLRAVDLDPSNRSLGSVNGSLYGELAAQWRLAPQWATELAVAVPQYFTVRGSPYSPDRVRLMPITWTGKYTFTPGGPLRPYLGAGIGYTYLTHESADTQASVQRSASGASWTVQAGCDLLFTNSYFVDADVRYLGNLEPGVYKIDPLLFGIGIGARY